MSAREDRQRQDAEQDAKYYAAIEARTPKATRLLSLCYVAEGELFRQWKPGDNTNQQYLGRKISIAAETFNVGMLAERAVDITDEESARIVAKLEDLMGKPFPAPEDPKDRDSFVDAPPTYTDPSL